MNDAVEAPPEAAVATPHDITRSLLYLNGVSVTFDGFRAINNLSLELAPGEMRAIIGPNGAGKTTMMDIITGKTRPDTGDVLFDRGTIDLTTKDEAAIAELGIGRKFQRPTVFENHTVEDNVMLALKGTRTVRGSLFWNGSGEEQARIGEILGTIGLTQHRRRLAGSLSHGQKQWLEIGMLIAQDPKLLLVDEPVAGMTDAEIHDDGRAAEGHRQGPFGGRGRARHGVRAPARRQGDGAARGLGAGGGLHRRGERQRARHRGVSGAVSVTSPLPIALRDGERARVRGGPTRALRPLSPTLPRKTGRGREVETC